MDGELLECITEVLGGEGGREGADGSIFPSSPGIKILTTGSKGSVRMVDGGAEVEVREELDSEVFLSSVEYFGIVSCTELSAEELCSLSEEGALGFRERLGSTHLDWEEFVSWY